MFYFNTVADAGLTQVFPVSTGKIQFFSYSRAVPWHQPFWMTQSIKGECIPMAPLCTYIPTLHITFLLPYFPFILASVQGWWQGHRSAWGTRNMTSPSSTCDILTWLRSLLCAGLPSAQKHRLPSTCMWVTWASLSHGSRVLTLGEAPLQAPSDPGPGWKAWFTHSWTPSWMHLASLLVVSLAGLEADASATAGLRKLSVLYTSTMAFLSSNRPDKTHSSHSALRQGHLLGLWCPRGSCLIFRSVS